MDTRRLHDVGGVTFALQSYFRNFVNALGRPYILGRGIGRFIL